MSATFYLSATWHPGHATGRKFLTGLLERLGKRRRVCYIGATHDDHPAWTRKTIEFLAGSGARVAAPRLSDAKLDTRAARTALKTADLLYLDGGDTVRFVQHVERHDLRDAFVAAARTCRFVFGLSGGACAAAPFTIGYHEDEKPYVADCLGMGSPRPLDVHDESQDWPEMRGLLRLVQKTRRAKQPKGIVIPSGSALVVAPDGGLASIGKAPCEVRALDARGRWVVTPIAAAPAWPGS